MESEIINNQAAHRFETIIENKTAFVDYELRPGAMAVLHTQVPMELEGRGIAATLAKHVLEYIAAEKLELVPLCPYMKAHLSKHPEYQYLIKNKEALS